MGSTVTSFGGKQSLGIDNFNCQVDADSGVWFDTSGILTASLQIKDLEIGETLTVHCSNNPEKPDDDQDEVTGQTVNGTGSDVLVAMTAPYSLWKKLKKSAGDTSEVLFAGVRRN